MHRSAARRRALVPLAVVTASVALAGCAPGTGTGAPTDGGGTLVYAITGANLTNGKMDPHSSQLDVTAYVMRNVLDSLVYRAADGTISPWLASDWTISDDARTYTFDLRDDVEFSDGTPLDAEAVKVNIEHVLDPDTASAQAASMLSGENFAGVEVVDDDTVEFTLVEPYAPLLGNLSSAFLGIYSPTVITEHAADLAAGGPEVTVGSGPFILSELVPEQQLTFTRNDAYQWGPEASGLTGPAVLDELDVRIVPEDSQRVGALGSGEADVVGNLTPSSMTGLPADAVVHAVESPGMPFSIFLNETNGALADPAVREAFARGIDIDTAVDLVFDGQYDRAWSILSPTTPDAYDASLEGAWPYDAGLAASLLENAGWVDDDGDGIRERNGEPLTLQWYTWTPIADQNRQLGEMFIADAKKIGIDVERHIVEPAEYNEHYAAGTFDLTDWAFAYSDGDILRNHLASTGFQNASHVDEPEIDAMLADAAASTDPAVRRDLYVQLQQWNAEHHAIVPIYLPQFITVSSPEVQGVQYDLFGWPLFAGASVGSAR